MRFCMGYLDDSVCLSVAVFAGLSSVFEVGIGEHPSQEKMIFKSDSKSPTPTHKRSAMIPQPIISPE
jgi:hypothetical protein